ncbi:hypothetical protein LUZ60_007679 [Juncus effusus]|nr:hypothetical protein LUZ60_007679 [Juncus effusus]
MASAKGALNLRNNSSSASSKQSFLLPPRSPFPTIAPHYVDPGPIGSKPNPKFNQQRNNHQRNASESFIDEQPSWLEDLLSEPDNLTGAQPIKKGAHRRSSSDSFTFFNNANNGGNVYNGSLDLNGSTWGGNGLVEAKPFYPDPNFKLRAWDSQLARQSNGPGKDRRAERKDADVAVSDSLGKEREEDQKAERKEKHVQQSEADTKRAKQQYAQRSRVRKLQYIAELERKVQSLQSEGMEASAELEFLSQQNIMLDLENKALKQRLESLAQEQLIKRYQQEMFEREVGRLRIIYQQQQQQQQQPKIGATHKRNNSRENLNLDSQFSNLSLKHKDSSSSSNSTNGPLRI